MAESPNINHTELLQKLRNNDSNAFGILYDIFNAKLVAYAKKYVMSEDLARDISHEALLRLAKNPPERAKNNNIPTEIISKKEYGSMKAVEEKMISVLDENGVDLIVLAGYMCILGEKFTAKYSKRIINVHPSLIPSFCGEGFYGLKVHEAALKKGVKVTGATVHFVNEIPDGGEIIMQKAVKVSAAFLNS